MSSTILLLLGAIPCTCVHVCNSECYCVGDVPLLIAAVVCSERSINMDLQHECIMKRSWYWWGAYMHMLELRAYMHTAQYLYIGSNILTYGIGALVVCSTVYA